MALVQTSRSPRFRPQSSGDTRGPGTVEDIVPLPPKKEDSRRGSHEPGPQTPSRPSSNIQRYYCAHSPRWYQRLAAWLVFATVRSRKRHLALLLDDRRPVPVLTEPVIFCFWHNRLALTTKAYYASFARTATTAGLAAMVSASKDGALLAAILERFKFQPVRGLRAGGAASFTGADHLGRARLRPGYPPDDRVGRAT